MSLDSSSSGNEEWSDDEEWTEDGNDDIYEDIEVYSKGREDNADNFALEPEKDAFDVTDVTSLLQSKRAFLLWEVNIFIKMCKKCFSFRFLSPQFVKIAIVCYVIAFCC